MNIVKDRVKGVNASGRRKIKEGRAKGRLKKRLKGVRNTLAGLKV